MTTTRRYVIFGSILLLVAAVLLLWTMRGGSTIDVYVAQLRAKGERLYFTDPPYPKMTNGTPGLDKLVSAADSIGGLTYIKVMDVNTSGVAVVAWQQQPIIDGYSNSVQWSQLHGALRQNQKFLRDIRESVAEPEPDCGWRSNIFTFRRTYVQQRRAAQALSAATVAALHETNYNEAFESLQALIRLAQMGRNDTTLVGQMIRVAISGLGVATTWEALQSDGFTDAQWNQLQGEFNKVNLLDAVEQGFVGERLLCFSHMEMARKEGTNAFGWSRSPVSWRDQLATTIWRATVAQQDELFYLKTVQRDIEHCRLVSKGTPVVAVDKLFQADAAELDRLLRKPLARFKYPMSLITIPNFRRAYMTAYECEIQRRLAITAVAVKRYQKRHGTPPRTLTALVPDFCSEVFLDPMDLKPLRYRLNTDKSCTLYSIGENGTDDGGNPAGDVNWLHALDIVWPKAADPNQRN